MSQLQEMGFSSAQEFATAALAALPANVEAQTGLSTTEVRRMTRLLASEAFEDGYRFSMKDRTWLNAHHRAEEIMTRLLTEYGSSRLMARSTPQR